MAPRNVPAHCAGRHAHRANNYSKRPCFFRCAYGFKRAKSFCSIAAYQKGCENFLSALHSVNYCRVISGVCMFYLKSDRIDRIVLSEAHIICQHKIYNITNLILRQGARCPQASPLMLRKNIHKAASVWKAPARAAQPVA